MPEPATTARPTTTTPVSSGPDPTADVGEPEPPSAEQLEHVTLLAEGVAVAYGTPGGDGVEGVLLADLDGRTVATLPGMRLRELRAPGALVLESPDGDLLVDPKARRIVPMTDRSTSRVPLANGAVYVSVTDADPGRNWVEQGGREVFDLDNLMANGAYVSYDRDVVTSESDQRSVAYDTRARTTVAVPLGCVVADRHGSRWLYLCRSEGSPVADELRIGRPGSTPAIAFRNPGDVGHWESAMFSNDGARVLLQWSAECEVPVAYVASVGGRLRRLPTPRATAVGLGWSAGDDAVVFVPTEPGCGTDDGSSGVHLVRADGSSTRTVEPPDGKRLLGAQLWTET